MTNSYKTGTVSVTNGSAVVNGTGTAWSIENVFGGRFVRGTFEAEILSVQSNTQLTLDTPFVGTTGAGQTYRIWLQDAQAASNITINRQLGEIIARLVDSAPEIQDFLDAATPGDALTALGVSSFIQTLLNDANQAAALATLGANNASNLSTGTIPDARLLSTAAIPFASAGVDATTNLNTLTSPGFSPKIYGFANPGIPASGYWYILTLQYGAANAVTQIAIPYGNSIDAYGIRIRGLFAGAWSVWEEIALKSFVAANYPRKPQLAAGAGQWVAISGANGAGYTLPAGGTWVYVLWRITTSTGVFASAPLSSISAGGTALTGAVAGQSIYGFAWRISE